MGTTLEEVSLETVKELVDALEAKLDSDTYGLSALNLDLDTIIKLLGTPAGASLAADILALELKLDNKTYGLYALNNDLDNIINLLINGVYGLPALNNDLDQIGLKLDNGTWGLAALKVLIDALELKLDTLQARLTALRAGYLDNINNAQLLNIPNLSTLTAARIGYLDNINQAGLLQLTALRAGYLDNINNAQLLNVPDLSTLTAARIGYLDEINAAALAQGGGSIASNAQVDSLVRAIADILRAGGTGDAAAIMAKTDLINSASGSGTLNDANTSDTIVPTSLPTKAHIIFDISALNNAGDDFTIEVSVGVAASERVVAYYKLTSNGVDITCDTGSGTGAIIKLRRIDISDILCFTGEQIIVSRTKNSATDRSVGYKYLCGV